MPTLNIASRNAALTALLAGYAGGTAIVRTGNRPAPDSAATGTVLGSITLPANPFGAVSNGRADKQGVWEDTAADASGTAGWLRLTTADGTRNMDFQIGVDANMADTTVVAGDPIRVDSAYISLPSGA